MSKLGRILKRRKNKRLSTTISASTPGADQPAGTHTNGKSPEKRPQQEIWHDIDEQPLGPLHARYLPEGGQDPDSGLIAVPIDGFADPTEVHDNLGQAHFERGYLHAPEPAGRMGFDLSAAFLRIKWLADDRLERDGKADSNAFGPVDADFDLVLRHFWKNLGAEKRRELIQIAASLLDRSEAFDVIKG